MKKTVAALSILVSLFVSKNCFASQAKAVGIFLGNPDSVTLKSWKSKTEAYDVGVSFSTGGHHYHIYADYIYNIENLIKKSNEFINQIDFYIGAGGFLINKKATATKESKTYLGIRAPFGIEWKPDVPFSVYFEVALGLSVVPETDGETFSGLGVRYFF